jgi:hypothetical protein
MVPEEVEAAGVVAQKKPWALAGAIGVVVIVALMILGQVLNAQELQGAEQQVPLGTLDEVTQQENEYSAAQAEANRLRQGLDVLAEPGIDRGIFLRVLPVLTDVIEGKNVYLSNLDFTWMEPSLIEAGVVPLATGGIGGRRVGMGPTAPMMGPAMGVPGMGGPPPGVRITGPGGTAPTAARPTGGRRGRTTAARARRGTEGTTAGASELVMRFACESREIALKYIEEEVIGALRNAQFSDAVEPAFTEVEMIGEVRDVWRDRVSGQEVLQGTEDAVRFVAFQGYAVVNTAPETEKQG